MPASYDVIVDTVKVGEMVGVCQGRNGDAHWHEFRDLSGNTLNRTVEVRGMRRAKLNELAVKIFMDIEEQKA